MGRGLADVFFNYSKCKHLPIGSHELISEYFMYTESETLKIQNVNSENDRMIWDSL